MCVSVLTYEVPFLRHVTSKQYIFVMFSLSIKVIIDQSQGQMSRSKVKVNCKRSRSRIFCIAAILFPNNTLLIAHFSFESIGPIDCVLDLCHCQSTR